MQEEQRSSGLEKKKTSELRYVLLRGEEEKLKKNVQIIQIFGV